MNPAALVTLIGALLLTTALPHSAASQAIPHDQLVFQTQEWQGERFADGRPKVPDDILERMKNVSLEQAWGTLRNEGFHNQYAGGWKTIDDQQPIIGRALTAQYMPGRPGLMERMTERGHEEGRIGPMNSWPIDMLEQGDVYVADGFGKIKDGTLIGDNLGNAIFARSGNGVVFDGSARDLNGLREIEGFNAYVRDWDPSYLQEVMLSGLNVPIRIGEAVVLPGDVVLARDGGIVFIPAHLAAQIVESAEIVLLRDQFGHQRLREGVYTAGQIDTRWTDEIRDDFFAWLEANIDTLPVPRSRIAEILETRTW